MNGIINLLKPPGMTSHHVVSALRRLTGIRKIGHTGTLDPGAAGVLPICIGQATRVAEYVLTMDKTYRAELTLGTATDTEDAAGQVIDEKTVPPLDFNQVKTLLLDFTGPRQQIPPMYSAVRVHGQKLYQLARRGETVTRKARAINIYQLQLLQLYPQKILFDVSCSRGTYIRTLCREIAEALDTVGHMSFLVRTRVGPYHLDQTYTLEECASLQAANELTTALLPLDSALEQLLPYNVTAEDAEKIQNGRVLKFTDLPPEGTLMRVYGPGGELLAISSVENSTVRPQKVFRSR
ncbi:MAG TPA: tRNA pseudouridine(55) synthase TruB [Oscillospiraceae bacterium]|nr:tRNA pseudouridine(55) synthase TruB [Oscillospiraceae bacterium]